jgi:hypothetical protein
MTKLTKGLVLGLFIAIFSLAGFSGKALAYSPTMSVYSSGNSTTVSISGGQPNTTVVITYTPSGSSLSSTVSGVTDYSGNFTTMVSSVLGSQINATVGGQQVYSNGSGYNGGGCTYYGCNVGGLTLSQTSLSLTVGQNSTVSIYNNSYSYGSYYVSSNSSSGVASVSLSGSSLYVNALSVGNTSVIICQSSYTSSCATLYVTVSGVLGANTNLWFSPANPSMNIGQSLAISINSSYYQGSSSYYNSSTYYISTNSNPSAVTATVSGTVLNLYANQTGSSTITVCNSGLSFCGSLYVTVNGGSSYGGTLSLNQSTITISPGQTVTVTGYNVPSMYVSSNSNTSAASVNVSGTQASFYGLNPGSGTVVLCGISSSQCGNVYFTVSNTYALSNVILSQYSLNMSVGQTGTVNASGAGGYGYYISTNSNPGVISASFNGSVINIYAIANGSASLQICQNSANLCATLYVNVGSGYYNNNGGTVLGANTYANGQLISEGSTVYIVYKNTKTAFANSSAFLGLGFKFSNVVSVGNSGLAFSGHTVTTSYGAHPWGSWVKSGSTVYFVSDAGLIPVPDWNTLTADGGLDSMIVPANIYDFRLPLLSPMTVGDYRLQ